MHIYKRVIPNKKHKGVIPIFNSTPECYLICNTDPSSNKLVLTKVGSPIRSLQDNPILYPNQLKIISKEFLLKWNFFCQRITDHVYEDLREMRNKQRYTKYKSGIIK